MGEPIFQKSKSRLKILGARKVTTSNIYSDDPKDWASLQNLVARNLCPPDD